MPLINHQPIIIWSFIKHSPAIYQISSGAQIINGVCEWVCAAALSIPFNLKRGNSSRAKGRIRGNDLSSSPQQLSVCFDCLFADGVCGSRNLIYFTNHAIKMSNWAGFTAEKRKRGSFAFLSHCQFGPFLPTILTLYASRRFQSKINGHCRQQTTRQWDGGGKNSPNGREQQKSSIDKLSVLLFRIGSIGAIRRFRIFFICVLDSNGPTDTAKPLFVFWNHKNYDWINCHDRK